MIKALKKNDGKRSCFVRMALLCLLVVLVSVFAVACGSSDEEEAKPTPTVTPTPSPTPKPTPTPTPEPTPTPDLHPGEVRSTISGEWIKEETAKLRPYVIMFNNLAIASPQSGTSEAKILYEILSEAGITRLMGVFEGLDENSSLKDRIGSVRSARHYFASFADDWDPIFIHYGETKYAARKIDALGLDDIDGITGKGEKCFYRDKTIKAPHNAFASLEGIKSCIETHNYDPLHKREPETHFEFYEEDTAPAGGTKAEYVLLPFSSYTSPYLTYDPQTKLYTRYQFGEVHKDYNTDTDLVFKNIIIMIVDESNIDKNGYQTMEIEDNTGEGYYVSDGLMIPITWEKNESEHRCVYLDKTGKKLTINPGKTFIAVFPDYRADKIAFEEPKETD
ncbi:MAG: DUF3048 domain-containing protein [Lachnospiraceae bacterium]|nr:DUF3048 domain-containing protein [Lachnospiraceae bacterium]